MAENTTGAGSGVSYPLTKMNFVVKVDSIDGTAAFTEVTGVEASVDVIEFRQGNQGSLAPMKIPGLVKHGNVTLKYGYVAGTALRDWIISSVSEQRDGKEWARHDITIELIDITQAGVSLRNDIGSTGGQQWKLTNAFVAKYSGVDLDAKSSDVAVESIEIAYEELTIPKA